MGTVVDYADVKVGDTIRVTGTDPNWNPVKITKVLEGAVSALNNAYSTDRLVFEGYGGTSLHKSPGAVIELIDRPEPSKPAAKVGDTLTRDHQIPPVGTKVVRVDEYDGRLLIRELQTDGRWHLLNSTEYAKATSLFSSVYDYSVVHLPSE